MTADKKFKRLVRDRARQAGESYSSARRELLRKRSGAPMNTVTATAADLPVEVTVAEVRTDDASASPVLILEEAGSGRQLPIYIGTVEAIAIAFALQQVAHSRPMSHDALKETLDAFGGRLLRVVIGFIADMNTFTADVVLGMADGTEQPSRLAGLRLGRLGRPLQATLMPKWSVPRAAFGATFGSTPFEARLDGFLFAWEHTRVDFVVSQLL